MRKYGIASLAVAVALAVPVSVDAAGKKFEGTVESGGTMSFTLKKTNNGKKVVKYTFAGVPAECTTGVETISGVVTFGIKVKHNEFQTKAVAGNPNNPNSELKLKGEINGDKAEGTLEVSGKKVLVDPGANDERAECATGKQGWTAEQD